MNLDKLGWPSSPLAFVFASLRLLLPIAPLLAAGPVRAGDGVLEISQTCAIETGCFTGDTPGFPVTIASAGLSPRTAV